eukprot:6651501-Pyramimonas_sp.AAC.1
MPRSEAFVFMVLNPLCSDMPIDWQVRGRALGPATPTLRILHESAANPPLHEPACTSRHTRVPHSRGPASAPAALGTLDLTAVGNPGRCTGSELVNPRELYATHQRRSARALRSSHTWSHWRRWTIRPSSDWFPPWVYPSVPPPIGSRPGYMSSSCRRLHPLNVPLRPCARPLRP